MKNCDPLVFGPALAMESKPEKLIYFFKHISNQNNEYKIQKIPIVASMITHKTNTYVHTDQTLIKQTSGAQ